LVMVGL